MEQIALEQTGAYTTYDVGMLLVAAVLFALSAALIAGGIIGYRKSREAIERTFAVVAMAGAQPLSQHSC